MAALLGAQASASPGLEDAFRTGLGAAGLSTASARFDPSILPFYRQGEFESPLYRAAYDDPWRVPFLLSAPRRQLYVSVDRPVESIGIASRLVGDGASRDFMGNPIQPTINKARLPGSLPVALNRMRQAGLITGPMPVIRGVPEEVQQAAALIIEAAMDAEAMRKAAFANAPEASQAASFRAEVTASLSADNAADYQKRLDLARKVEMSYLHAAAQELATAAVEARRIIGAAGRSADYAFKVPTTWGAISLTGRAANDHAGPVFVAIDTGGDDTWVGAGGTQSWANWCSVVVDTSGKDAYLSDPALKTQSVASWSRRQNPPSAMGPAGGLFGIGMVVDSEGDDLYRSTAPGLGAGIFGSGILIDLAGDDTYDCSMAGQGFGRFGIGLLEDIDGDDTYDGFNQVQGCGATRGVGLLLDRAGNDVYTANDSVIDFPSAQSPEHNLSMAQGAGVGFRADYLTGRSQAGGIGILLDSSGDDKYTAGVFGQGVGYWMGLGALWDEEGNDSYRAFWYGMGAGAHFSVGVLEDGKGADTYLGQRFLTMGAGHDFGLGMLIDRAGGDLYKSGSVSMGGASENGIGVFADLAGDDRYDAGGISLGYTTEATGGSLRERALSFGAFFDLGGRDEYGVSAPWARNGVTIVNWRTKNTKPQESQLGVFQDRA